MKARTLLCGLALCTLGAVAQTEVSPYVPGATVEGVTYYLPRTALRLVVVAEKQVYTPGEFSKYADRYLRLSQINQEPYTKWSIKSIDMATYGVPDPQKVYSIQLKKRTWLRWWVSLPMASSCPSTPKEKRKRCRPYRKGTMLLKDSIPGIT